MLKDNLRYLDIFYNKIMVYKIFFRYSNYMHTTYGSIGNRSVFKIETKNWFNPVKNI